MRCAVGMPSVPSTLGSADESQRPVADRQRQASDAAANRAAAIAVAASSGAGYASGASGRSSGQMNASLLSSSAPETSSRSFLDPLGIVEKVCLQSLLSCSRPSLPFHIFMDHIAAQR